MASNCGKADGYMKPSILNSLVGTMRQHLYNELGPSRWAVAGNSMHVLTSCTVRGVLSSCGRCSSNPNTMQLAMIVRSTMYSNGVHRVKEMVQAQIPGNETFQVDINTNTNTQQHTFTHKHAHIHKRCTLHSKTCAIPWFRTQTFSANRSRQGVNLNRT